MTNFVLPVHGDFRQVRFLHKNIQYIVRVLGDTMFKKLNSLIYVRCYGENCMDIKKTKYS